MSDHQLVDRIIDKVPLQSDWVLLCSITHSVNRINSFIHFQFEFGSQWYITSINYSNQCWNFQSNLKQSKSFNWLAKFLWYVLKIVLFLNQIWSNILFNFVYVVFLFTMKRFRNNFGLFIIINWFGFVSGSGREQCVSNYRLLYRYSISISKYIF